MKKEFSKKELTKKTQNFSRWYQEVILKTELADYAPVKGCMVIRPYGYALWENIQKELDKMIKDLGVKNAYFPLFIPERFLKKEKEHVEGFSPELAVVTIGGGEELKEKLVVRPTSETIMYAMYAKWIKSWRDLPVLINQWNNIVRWEKRTYLFLRTTEFLWQEGHTAHESHNEALEMVKSALLNYKNLYQNYLAIFGYSGLKSQSEKFAGALNSFSYEILTPEGKSLQGATSHDLGQNFSKVFNIRFLGQDKKLHWPYQTSWGLSTRSIGALVMVHGDDNGLILPPKISPIQVIILPVWNNRAKETIRKKVEEIRNKLSAFRIEIDWRDETLGYRINDWEMRGVPLRIELGQKEMDNKIFTLVRRDNFEKLEVKEENLIPAVEKILAEIQNNLYERSRSFTLQHTFEVKNYTEFKEVMRQKKGLVRAFWCEDPACEGKIKEETKATTRCLPLEDLDKHSDGKCIYCGKTASRQWLFGPAY